MGKLLDNRLRPITNSYAFLETDLNTLVNAFMKWRLDLGAAKRKYLSKDASLEETLMQLCPLESFSTKFLFIPTNSSWVAMFDSSPWGTDSAAPSYISEMLRLKYIKILCDLQRGSTMMDFIDYNLKHHNNENNAYLRIVGAIIEGRGTKDIWKLYEKGEPLPFENPEYYKARLIKNRFTPEIMDEYLQHFGIRAFDEDFYDIKTGPVMVEQTGKRNEHIKLFTLEEAQNYYNN